MNIIKLEKPNDLLQIVEDLYESIGENFNKLWWRGHADLSWKLIPSVYRPKYYGHETWLMQDFLRRAKTRYNPCPPENAWPDWLILMQHHGLPTRLLDWSESVFVAVYFAVSEIDDRDGAVWVMNPYDFNVYENNTQRILDCYEVFVIDEFEKAFKSGLRNGRTIAVQMPENHERMLVQHAAFTVHGNDTPIDELDGEKYIARIDIPANLKKSLKTKLTQLGFTTSYLFPDLDHLALDMKERHSIRRFLEQP
jgi:hypothetical protein